MEGAHWDLPSVGSMTVSLSWTALMQTMGLSIPTKRSRKRMLISRTSTITLKAGLTGSSATPRACKQVRIWNPAGLLESSDQTEALRGFQEVVKMEPDKAEWYNTSAEWMPACTLRQFYGADCRGFKALKQIVKIHFKLGNHKDMLKAYK